ncbi:NADH:flavin oxidoreductase/NADH oxidase [Oceanobacillus sp. CAU 1775]
MNKIATPFEIKNLSLKNRIVMAPMCQFCVEREDGVPNEWHYVHYVSRAVGGTALVLVEATSVTPEGRITNQDLGLWEDEQIPAYKRIVDEVHQYDAKIGIQLAHAGIKARDAIQAVGPSSQIDETSKDKKKAQALTLEEIEELVQQFQDAARRAIEAGFDTIEIHGAHGYLIHQFTSPTLNKRTDAYGEDRSKFGVEVIRAVKAVIPKDMPLFMRMSAIEYVDGGYDIDYAIQMAEKFKEAGIDVFHLSSGGEGMPGKLKPGNYPGYQVPFARAFREKLNIPVIAVGMLESPELVEATLANEDADLVAIGRGMLNDPYWGLHAIKAITGEVKAPNTYARAIR